MVVYHGRRRAHAAEKLQRRETASHCWACGGVSGSRCTHGRSATRVHAPARGKNKSQRATTAVPRTRCSKIVEPLRTEFYACMDTRRRRMTGLQPHLCAAWSDGLGERLGVERTPRAAVLKERIRLRRRQLEQLQWQRTEAQSGRMECSTGATRRLRVEQTTAA